VGPRGVGTVGGGGDGWGHRSERLVGWGGAGACQSTLINSIHTLCERGREGRGY
jgi:hypothetical protein